MSWELDHRPLRRVLVTRLRYLGDVVMASVVADALRRGDPDLEIGFLCESGHAPVLAGHAALTRVHTLAASRRGADATARGQGKGAIRPGRGSLGMMGELRAAQYDLAVDLFFNPRSAWLLRLAGIPLRIGGTAGSRRQLYTHSVPRSKVDDPRGVLGRRAPGGLGEHLCRLVPLVHASSGRSFLEWLDDEGAAPPLMPRLTRPALPAAAAAALEAVGIPSGAPYLLAAPGATWPSKQWPAGHWQQLLPAVIAGTGLPLATLVPPGAGEVWRNLPSALPPLPLDQVLGLVAGSRALVAVDGGVMHAGVGLGVPVLALFGPTDPEIWFPYEAATASRVLATRPACHPCDRLQCPAAEFVCLPGLEPAVVLQGLVSLLAATSNRAGDRP